MNFQEIHKVIQRIDDHTSELDRHECCHAGEKRSHELGGVRLDLRQQMLPTGAVV